MSKSVAVQNGELYALNLHSLATEQNPLYGSGGGRWFFGTSTSKPLLDLSAVYQGSLRFLTGRYSASDGTVRNPHISDSSIA